MRRLVSLIAPAALVAAAVTALACHGQFEGSPPPPGATGGSNGTGGTGAGAPSLALATQLAAANPCTSNAPGPRKLWRLTAAEFAASIRSIFDDTANAAPLATVFSDPSVLGFSIDANGLLVQGLNASQLQDNAEAVASWAASSGKLASFAGCASSTSGAPDSTCATQFVQAFGRAAFRTTLVSNDPRVASYKKLFLSGSSSSDGAQVVVAAMLQSPSSFTAASWAPRTATPSP